MQWKLGVRPQLLCRRFQCIARPLLHFCTYSVIVARHLCQWMNWNQEQWQESAHPLFSLSVRHGPPSCQHLCWLLTLSPSVIILKDYSLLDIVHTPCAWFNIEQVKVKRYKTRNWWRERWSTLEEGDQWGKNTLTQEYFKTRVMEKWEKYYEHPGLCKHHDASCLLCT